MWPEELSDMEILSTLPFPAQRTFDLDNALELVMWGGLLLVSVALLVLFTNWARKKMREDPKDDSGGIMTLQDIREMRDRGDISIQEYENLRNMILAGAKKMLDKDDRVD